MLPHQLSALVESTPPGLAETLRLLDAVDDLFTDGLARPDAGRGEIFDALADAFAASPLADRVAEATGKIGTGAASDEQFAVLAGARTALWGAVHDSLQSQVDTVLDRRREPAAEPVDTGNALPPNLLAGCRTWLTELAITGWRGVDEGILSSAAQTVEALLAHPDGRRAAVLLDGLVAELRACSPIANRTVVPSRRWADLWTRATTLANGHSPAAATAETTFTGRLLPLGTELYQHSTAFGIRVHWLAEPADGSDPRLLRTGLTAAKVDTILGPSCWRLLAGHPTLLTAVAQDRAVSVTELPLRSTGDLLWDESAAEAGDPTDPLSVARVSLARAIAPATAPWDRHPTAIAEPVFLEGYKVPKADRLGFKLGDTVIDIDTDRLTSAGPLTDKLVKSSTTCLGLLRWEAGRWLLQPLTVQAPVKKVPTTIHNGQWALGPTDPKAAKAEAKNGTAVELLRERAGRLLRK